MSVCVWDECVSVESVWCVLSMCVGGVLSM